MAIQLIGGKREKKEQIKRKWNKCKNYTQAIYEGRCLWVCL